jgi:hypothetical protein
LTRRRLSLGEAEQLGVGIDQFGLGLERRV